MFERKWENQTPGMKERLAYGMCTAQRVTVSAAYLLELERENDSLRNATFTREDAELLTTEIERLERAKAEAETKLMYAQRKREHAESDAERELVYAASNRERAEKRAAAAAAERDAMRVQVAELKAMVRAMRESLPRPTVQEGQWRPADERPEVQTATEAEPLLWVVADGTEKPSRWDFLEVDR